MSAFYPFRGGVTQRGHCLLFFTVFSHEGFPEFILIQENAMFCSFWYILKGNIPGAKLSWCQIVRFYRWFQIVWCQIVLVPNCPGAKLSGADFFFNREYIPIHKWPVSETILGTRGCQRVARKAQSPAASQRPNWRPRISIACPRFLADQFWHFLFSTC